MEQVKQSATAKLAKLDEILNKYENDIGLSVTCKQLNPEAVELLSVQRSYLQGLTATECEENSILLKELSIDVQRLINLEKSREDWAEETIKKVIANDLTKYEVWHHEQKRMMAIADSEHATRLNQIKLAAHSKVTRLFFLSQRISECANSYSNLAKIKKAESYQ